MAGLTVSRDHVGACHCAQATGSTASSSSRIAQGPPCGGGGGEAAEEASSTVDVVLTSAGDKKIQVIKVVRSATGLGLKEAKVESCNPPEPDSQASYDVALADPSSEPTSKEAFFNVRMPICNNPDDTPCSKWIPSLDLIKNGPLARLHNVDMVVDQSPRRCM